MGREIPLSTMVTAERENETPRSRPEEKGAPGPLPKPRGPGSTVGIDLAAILSGASSRVGQPVRIDRPAVVGAVQPGAVRIDLAAVLSGSAGPLQSVRIDRPLVVGRVAGDKAGDEVPERGQDAFGWGNRVRSARHGGGGEEESGHQHGGTDALQEGGTRHDEALSGQVAGAASSGRPRLPWTGPSVRLGREKGGIGANFKPRVGAGLDGREGARPALARRNRPPQGGASPQPARPA